MWCMSGRREGRWWPSAPQIGSQTDRRTTASGMSLTSEHLEALMARRPALDGAVIDVLVNNAGIAGPTAPLAEVTLEEWNETLAVNLTGVFLACKAALSLPRACSARQDRQHRFGYGQAAAPQPAPPMRRRSSAVVGLTRTLAHEVGPLGISVNVISPWLVEGDRLGDVIAYNVAGTRPQPGRAPQRNGGGDRAQTYGQRRRHGRVDALSCSHPPTT